MYRIIKMKALCICCMLEEIFKIVKSLENGEKKYKNRLNYL